MPNYTQKNTATKGTMAAQQGGRPMMGSVKGNALKSKLSSTKSSSSSTKPKEKTTVLAATGGEDKFKTGFKMGRIKSTSKPTATQIPNTEFDELTVAEAPNNFKFERIDNSLAAKMRGKAMTSDEIAVAPSRQVMQDRENIDFDSSTDRGIESLYTGKRQEEEYHQSGLPKFITSVKSGEKFNTTTGGIDEGSFSEITTKIPERPKVTATESGENYEKGEEFYVGAARMHAQHPSQQRMENMVNKVATYNMPNVKAAQKKYHK